MNLNLTKHKLAMHVSLLLAAGMMTAGCAGNSAKKTDTEVAQRPIVSVTPKDEKTESAQINAISWNADQTIAESTAETEKTNQNENRLPEIEIGEASRPEQLSFQFGFDKAELSEEDQQIVVQHARFLAENPEMIIKIKGHTDHQGPRTYNEYLSKKRAEAVASVLIEQGVPESQLEIVAMGFDAPLADNEDAGKNRRVELEYSEINLVSNNNQ